MNFLHEMEGAHIYAMVGSQNDCGIWRKEYRWWVYVVGN